MIELCNVYHSIEQKGSRICNYDIGFAPAVTMSLSDELCVFIDTAAIKSVAALKYLLIHEEGHCATGALHSVSSPFELIEKNEHKADRWTFENYITITEIKEAISYGYTEMWQLAEWFDLPEKYLRKAVKFYKENRNIDFNTI